MPMNLLVIAGPNAGGKTRLGVEVAHALRSEIISADSRQTYRGMDIGSGKDLDEYRTVTPPVPYHLIDVADPGEVYSVYHFQRDCYRLLEEKAKDPVFAGGRPLVMVGGTGLFIEAVIRGFRIPNVPENVELRERLMRRDHEELVEELREADPELYEGTDRTSKKRVVRALEIADHARRGPVQYSPPPPVRIGHTVFVVRVSAEDAAKRIDRRLDERLEQGMIEEVRGLLDSGVSPERMAQIGLEYREVTAFLTGAKTEEQMVRDLRREIRRLAKRQRTWFRGLERRGVKVTWIDAGDVETILSDPLAAGFRR
jgi:tRNA dimethylallyltransferase